MSVCALSHLLLAATRRLEAGGIPAGEARREARILLGHALGISHEEMRLRPEREVSGEDAARFESLVARRAAREPLAYLTGTRPFYGLTFEVTPAVLIPRPETEFVVEAALAGLGPDPKLLDVGTGSGCIAIAVAVNAPAATVYATDLSPEALAIARRNAARNGVAERITFAEGDLLAPVADAGPFDVIASNPPYIAPEEIERLEPEVRDWEPRLALGTHPDALHFYRRLAAEAPPLLVSGGALIAEVGQGQAEAVMALWRAVGLLDVHVIPDLAGIPRVVTGRRSTPGPAS
jgi:protein-(glutamine-N5) methyltransferase, release factor-specific